MTSTWYDDFFTELPNAFWRAAVPPEATDAEIDFLVRTTGLRPGDNVLDVCCGSGRHVLALARHGYHVTGIDVSAEAIAYARRATAAEGLTVDLRVGDVRTLPTDVRTDVAICMGNAFGYLEHEGTQAFLADLAKIVRPGGALVLDYGFAAESMLPGVALEEEPMTIGGVEATSVNTYDVAESRWITEMTFRRGENLPVARISDPDLAGTRDRVGDGHGADLGVLPRVAVVLGPEDLHRLAIRRVRGHRILLGVLRIGCRERVVGGVAGTAGVELARLCNHLCGPRRPLVRARAARSRCGGGRFVGRNGILDAR